MKKLWMFGLLWIGCMLWHPAAHTAETVACVIGIGKGNAFFDDGKATQLIQAGCLLPKGTRIRLAPGCEVTLLHYLNQKIIRIGGKGTITVDTLKKEEGNITIIVENIGFLPAKTIPRVGDFYRYGGGVIRGEQDERKKSNTNKICVFTLYDTAIRDLTPVFRWQPHNLTNQYVLNIRDSDHPPVEFKTDKTKSDCPKCTFKSGNSYEWTVYAIQKGVRIASGNGYFRVLDDVSVKQLKQTEREINLIYPKETPEKLMVRALIFMDYGLVDESYSILKKLQAMFPDNKNYTNWANLLPIDRN